MGWGARSRAEREQIRAEREHPYGFQRQTLDRPVTDGDDPRDLCPKAPSGWLCTRKPGHDGPCAAVPLDKAPA